MQAIMEYRLRMKMKKQEDIKNEDPSEVKFSCRGCSKDICTGRDIEIIENIHRVNVTPQFRWELLHPEPTSVARSCSSACLCRFVQNKNEMPLFFFFSYSELFIRKENTKLKNNLLDFETNGYIACGNCGQVGNRCETSPIAHEWFRVFKMKLPSLRWDLTLPRHPCCPCMYPPQTGVLTLS